MLIVAIAAAAIFSPTASVTTLPPARHQVSIIIPLYSDPGTNWGEVMEAKSLHPDVPMVAIVNMLNGPGTAVNQTFASSVLDLEQANVSVIGYVATGYGSKPFPAVEGEIKEWRQFYNVQGILLDEMSSAPSDAVYYIELDGYAGSLGMPLVIGNPGTSSPSDHLNGTIAYENPGLPPWPVGSFVAYSVPSFDVSTFKGLAARASYVYVTDQGLPNPYALLPSYFLEEVAAAEDT